MKDTERKLATILATDCVSFSKYMEDAEEKTLRNLNECRKIIDHKIVEYGGKIFSTAGDSKEDFEKCISWGEKIQYMEASTWLTILYSVSKNDEISNVKDHNIYKKYESNFKETDWEKTIDNMNFRPEDEKNNILLFFANKMFPQIKIVEKIA